MPHVRHVDINIGFSRVERTVQRDRVIRAVDQSRNRISALGNIWGVLGIKGVKILLVEIAALLV